MLQEKIVDLENQNRLLNEINRLLKEKTRAHNNNDTSFSQQPKGGIKDTLISNILSDSSDKTLEKFEELKKLISEKDDFIKMVNSDLVAAVVHTNGMINELLSCQHILDGEPLKIVQKISFKSKAILKMLHDISHYQKISQNNLVLIKTKHELGPLITKIVLKIRDDILRSGCVVTTELVPNLFCYYDGQKVEEVLTNVLFNAIDFSNTGNGMVHIKSSYNGQHAEVVIKDNGIGINPNNLEKIFDRFVQLDTSLFREHKGCGLGLTISKGIVESHGGKIWAESRGTDTGTEIHILLPLENKTEAIRRVE